MAKQIRAAMYLRVSTLGQTVENQRLELEAAAAARGWVVAHVYVDQGISGAKGRDARPQLDLMLKDAVRRKFDVVMTWAVDRLGRSLSDLLGSMQALHGSKVDLFILQSDIDTTTPGGRMVFQMTGAFAEYERAMIQSRVNAGLARAKAAGVTLGRPKVSKATETSIKARLATGEGMVKIGKALGIGTGTVQRIKAEMLAA